MSGERTRLTTRLCLCRTITRDGGPGAAWALAWFSFTVGTGVDIFPVLLLFFAYSITVYVRVSEIRSIRQCFAAPAASTYLSSRSPGSPSAALAPCQRSKHEAAAARARALTHHFTHSTPHASRSHTHRMTRLVLSDAASHSPHARQQYNMRPPLAIARRSQRPRPLEQDSVHHGSLITRHTPTDVPLPAAARTPSHPSINVSSRRPTYIHPERDSATLAHICSLCLNRRTHPQHLLLRIPSTQYHRHGLSPCTLSCHPLRASNRFSAASSHATLVRRWKRGHGRRICDVSER